MVKNRPDGRLVKNRSKGRLVESRPDGLHVRANLLPGLGPLALQVRAGASQLLHLWGFGAEESFLDSFSQESDCRWLSFLKRKRRRRRKGSSSRRRW